MQLYPDLMRLLKALGLLSLALFLVTACEEDFKITEPYKDITVVYGLLDQGDDTTYLRINKAFLGEGNVLLMAQVEDSSIYKTGLTAVIEEYSSGNLVNSFTLDTVTVDSKVEGLFYNPYQLVYFAPLPLSAGLEYRLRLNIHGKEVTAVTPLVNDFFVTRPNPGTKFIHFAPGVSTAVEWESAKNGKRYDVYMRLRFKEVWVDSPDTIYRSEEWNLGTKKSVNVQGGAEMVAAYENDAFYIFLMDRVPYEDPATEARVQWRYSESMDVIIEVAAEEFNTYMEVNEPSNSIVQDRPDYSNITNGIGLFSSRYRKILSKKLHAETIQNIQTLPVELRFVY